MYTKSHARTYTQNAQTYDAYGHMHTHLHTYIPYNIFQHRQELALNKHTATHKLLQEVASLRAQLITARQDAHAKEGGYAVALEKLRKTNAELASENARLQVHARAQTQACILYSMCMRALHTNRMERLMSACALNGYLEANMYDICAFIRIYVHIYTHIRIYIYIFTYTHIHTHLDTYTCAYTSHGGSVEAIISPCALW
jgi:hypothetical protein